MHGAGIDAEDEDAFGCAIGLDDVKDGLAGCEGAGGVHGCPFWIGVLLRRHCLEACLGLAGAEGADGVDGGAGGLAEAKGAVALFPLVDGESGDVEEFA